jgi:ERCC4-type nuclease
MKIIIDEREISLYDKCMLLSPQLSIEKRVLHLGDTLITNDDDETLFIIERKSLTDLISSIKDGRYEEQSYRLIHSSVLCRHNIIYIIEGMLSQLRTPVEKKMVYSAMTTLQIFKGFSVVRTNSIQETAEWITNSTDKIQREIIKGNQIWSNYSTNSTETPPYCTVVKQTKKENLTPANIGEILLCQIPSISSVSAIAIMKQYYTISNLIDNIKTNPNCLDNIMCETKGGKPRKLGKNVIQNIIIFLC